MSLGIFLSTFARTELQVIQFIPLVIVPQFLLSGVLFPVGSLPSILQPLVAIMPLGYAVDGLRQVFIRGADLPWARSRWTSRVLALVAVLFAVDRVADDPPRGGVSARTALEEGADEPAPDRRRPGSGDTRGRILAAARTAFAERGFDGATVRDVAARGGGRSGARPPLLRDQAASSSSLRWSSLSTSTVVVPGLLCGSRDDW